MFELLTGLGVDEDAPPPDPVDWAVAVESVKKRSYRLVYHSASAQATSGMIGCHEFWLYDADSRNICRTAGFIPKLGWSKKLTQGPWWDPNTHGPAKTIDGDISNWASTCYGNPSLDGTAFIQYTFLDDFTPVRWAFKCEGAYIPGNPGVKLLRLNAKGFWIDVSGTGVPAAWGTGSTKNFTMPAISD